MAELRIGDDDREEAVRLLGEQYALGRLVKDELDERSDAAWSARTRSDLAPLFADLPVAAPSAGQGTPARAVVPPGLAGPPPGWRGVGRFVVPVLLVLVVLTVVTHLPLVLLAVVLWLALSRRHAWSHGGRGYRRFR